MTFILPFDNIIDGSLVKRLRRRPLTAETRVRFPYGLLTDFSKGKSFLFCKKNFENTLHFRIISATLTIVEYCTRYESGLKNPLLFVGIHNFCIGTVKVLEIEKEGETMSKRQDYEAQTEALILPILEKYGFELYDVEYVKEGSTNYLRAYIDKPGGIAVNDCETVAREMNPILDEKDYIPDSYVFEVSSPGLGRPLKKDKHLEKSIGEEVEIRTFRPINHEKQFTGILKRFDADNIVIEDEEETELTFARADIALIRLAFDF